MDKAAVCRPLPPSSHTHEGRRSPLLVRRGRGHCFRRWCDSSGHAACGSIAHVGCGDREGMSGSSSRGRRALLATAPLLAIGGLSGIAPLAVEALPSFIESTALGLLGDDFDIEAVLGEGKPRIRSPGISWSTSNRSKQVFFPAWMEGAWSVTAEFDSFYAPLGMRFTGPSTPGITKASVLAMADTGASPVRYRARFVASEGEGGIVADREFNMAECMDAFLARPNSVRKVEYDPLTNPTRYGVIYATPRRDGGKQAEDLRKAEVFINNRASRSTQSSAGRPAFLFAEFQRQVGQAARQGSVSDYMVATRLEQQTDGGDVLAGVQRVAAFLQPQDPAYFDVGGQAVAVYTYKLSYERIAKPSAH
eukprot:CAMPEP_0117682404 /NCGR_PEP_ID=MMETSP0804-20121206/19637_1 /TAXON_ID=1074897 /ORGANISM="Tetraselmis astigmatica, Strain CCMP880" /LENGTH=363 /DNA_ID=CAMNT_0005492505 /DNA_START=156 /DNA_END=1247 /DNA_ORIENTATION=+